MKNSNKVLLIAAVAALGFILAFVVVMGLKTRDLFERHRYSASGLPSHLPAASRTIERSFWSTALPGSRERASSSASRAS